jgi:predicted nucleic acid-binding protein
MNVLVDTSIWSLALRRKAKALNSDEQKLVATLTELIREGRVVMMGVLRQEILSGLKDHTIFEKLSQVLRAFPDETLSSDDYEEAARCYNRCRSKGIASSTIDMLICAVALRRQLAIFTTDPDFSHYAKHLTIQLHQQA